MFNSLDEWLKLATRNLGYAAREHVQQLYEADFELYRQDQQGSGKSWDEIISGFLETLPDPHEANRTFCEKLFTVRDDKYLRRIPTAYFSPWQDTLKQSSLTTLQGIIVLGGLSVILGMKFEPLWFAAVPLFLTLKTVLVNHVSKRYSTIEARRYIILIEHVIGILAFMSMGRSIVTGPSLLEQWSGAVGLSSIVLSEIFMNYRTLIKVFSAPKIKT